MRKSWWKILSFLILVYTIVAGFLGDVPRLFILNETIRNLYFHVCMWMAMMVLFTLSIIYSIKYLGNNNYRYDIYAKNYAAVGVLFGLLGYATGAIWANYTWVTDQGQSLGAVLKEPKLIGAAIAVLIYCAYFVLRGSFLDMDKRARVSAVYNIFAFSMLFPSIWIIPRLVGSLHPGAPGSDSGNPALNFKDIDSRLRMVFYPAVIGWTLLGVWIGTLKIRLELMKEKSLLHE
ncbi:MAG: ABC transporter permease [Chitinophagaceae bacterium]|nr:ABC transporter permease [Chitinophagaceae bacterium]MBP6046412.1 ABC transporter permease [Ferruginibacter sp.]MBK7089538.1 ABC transporter permease [Chitinophagaceae bacterium]MBK7347264.1 ABC transporter permease [Chitinophagaceae bacterium]MBK7733927.1 ABC transporter permease [Chitinophagaceae bacterium]